VNLSFVFSNLDYSSSGVRLLVLLIFFAIIRSANSFILDTKIVLGVWTSLLSGCTATDLSLASERWLAARWLEFYRLLFLLAVSVES